ncbi:hypothetical protein TNCV_617991 [Trichonephila clavipes]|nr:hypothetical protein TNCV_617991 [Trichonephila clavipes]
MYILVQTFDTRITGYGGQEVAEATGGVFHEATEKLKKQSVINLQPIFRSTNTNHAKAMLSATIAVFFTVAPTGRNPYMGRARFELRTGVTINEETTPEKK